MTPMELLAEQRDEAEAERRRLLDLHRDVLRNAEMAQREINAAERRRNDFEQARRLLELANQERESVIPSE